MDQLKVEMVGREVIKPASPSPQDRIQLSIFDLNCPAVYVQMFLFYEAKDLVNVSPAITSEKLKSSLSKTLSGFFPLAGRIEGVSINCNDEGAIFDEARTDLFLPDFLRNLNTDSLVELLPKMDQGYSPAEWPLLTVKVTYFGSGSGVAVSVSVSHKICDAPSLLTFLENWATTTADDDDVAVSTIQFAETIIYPTPPISSQSLSMSFNLASTRKCVMNRLVFESSKIAQLKREAASERIKVPTRVEAITSLIWRCARNATSHSNLVEPRSTLMFLAVDLRLRLPSTVYPIGNLQTTFFLKKSAESELELREAVATFRETKERVNNMIKENLEKNKLGQSLLNEMGNVLTEVKPDIDIDIYATSSWCRKPFYEVDFGWGTPVWIRPAIQPITDFAGALLIDSKDGKGVEAWVCLPEKDMLVFVHDQELLAYAVLNPPVLIYTRHTTESNLNVLWR